MKITDMNEQTEKLPEKIKTPILAIIEMKAGSGMEKVLQGFESIEKRFENIEKRLENRIGARESKINILLWTIGGGFNYRL